MRTAAIVGAVLFAGVVALGVVFVVGMRRKAPFVLNAVRRVSRTAKPLALRTAGTAESPTAVVEHVGRRSGTRYETPVVAAPVDDGFVIALPYGDNTDWLRNVLAAGSATLRYAGGSHDVVRPEVVAMAEVDGRFATKEQRMHRRFRIGQALLVHTTAVAGRAGRPPSPAPGS